MMLTIIKEIGGLFLKYIINKKELATEAQKTKMLIEQNKQRLAIDKQTYNHAWEMAALTNGDKFIRRLSFLMFSAPFIIAIFAPHHIHVYFEQTISVVPKFWQDTWMAINGGIWGISSLKDAIPGIIQSFKR